MFQAAGGVFLCVLAEKMTGDIFLQGSVSAPKKCHFLLFPNLSYVRKNQF
jgi:hypothetical protein